MASPGLEFVEAPVRVVAIPATSEIGGLMGSCPRGRTDKVQLVQTWAEFEALYGGFDDTNDSADLAVHYWDYIRHGGQRAYLLRVAADDAAQAASLTGVSGKYNDTVTPDPVNGPAIEVTANNLGAWGNRLAVSFIRDEFTAITEAPQAGDANGDDLPDTAFNADSRASAQYELESLVGVQIGDVLDVIDPATGIGVHTSTANVDPLVVADIVPAENAIRFVIPGTTGDYAAALSGAPYLRTCSNHLARTYALEQFADGIDNILLASVEGIERGSLLTFTMIAHVPTRAAVGFAAYESVIVDRVVGNRVYFTAAKSTFNAATIPAQSYAQVWMSDADLDATGTAGNVAVQATQAGPAGNDIVFQVINGAALSVAVTGRTVSVTVNTGVTTWGNIRTAVAASAAASALITVPASAFDTKLPHNGAGAVNTLSFTLKGGARLNVTSQEFQMGVTVDGVAKETTEFKNLSLISTSRNYIEKRYGGSSNGSYLVPADNNPSTLLILTDPALAATDPVHALPYCARDVALAGGLDGSAPSADDYIGAESPRAGIWLFEDALDVAALAAPSMTDVSFQSAAIDYAEARQDIWLMLDMPSNKTTEQTMRTYREIDLGSRSSYAGLFAPHGYIADPRSVAQTGDIMAVPPTPAAMGLTMKRIRDKGAHQSAGNQRMRWLRTAFAITPAEHTRLNEAGVSIARVLPGLGLHLYGDRTLSNFSGDGRKFANVRRWLNYMKRSLNASLAWAPFEPANTSLMAKLQNVVNGFLYEEWRRGALFPDTDASRSFQVKCDEETTTETDLANGRVNVQIKVSPVVPAETIIFNIQTSVGGVSVVEA